MPTESSKGFTPSGPEYRTTADLPEEHREEFVDVSEGGFVRKEAKEHQEEATDLEAIIKSAGTHLQTGIQRENIDILQTEARIVDKDRDEKLQAERDELLSALSEESASRGYGGGDSAARAGTEIRVLNAWEHLSPSLFRDQEFLLKAVETNEKALLGLPKTLREDEVFGRKAVEVNPYALQYVSAELRNDRDLVLTALSKSGSALEYASPELRDDRDIVLAAINGPTNAYVLHYASDRLRDDTGVVRLAVEDNPDAVRWASPRIRKLLDEALERDGGHGEA